MFGMTVRPNEDFMGKFSKDYHNSEGLFYRIFFKGLWELKTWILRKSYSRDTKAIGMEYHRRLSGILKVLFQRP